MHQKFFIESVSVPQPAELVWLILADVESWPQWKAGISRVVPLTPGPLSRGSQLQIRRPRLPAACWQVVDWRPGQGLSWMITAPGLRVTASHEVAPNQTGSRVTSSLWYQGIFGSWLAQWTHDLNRRHLLIEVEGLKARCARGAAESIPHHEFKPELVPILAHDSTH